MNNNSINYRTPRTVVGTVCEIFAAVVIVLSVVLSIVMVTQHHHAGSAMLIQSGVMAFSTALMLFLAYCPSTFNIPDDSPAEVFDVTVLLLRVISILSALLSLVITLSAMFGKNPKQVAIGYVVVVIAFSVWYTVKAQQFRHKGSRKEESL